LPEQDDDKAARHFDDANMKVNEFLYRRADLEDVVSAHLLAMDRAPKIGFGRYAAAVVKHYLPSYEAEYRRRGWSMMPAIDRVQGLPF